MDLLSERIFFTDEQQRQPVRKMATFIGLYYARFFLCTRIVCYTRLDDYKFYCQMVDYKDHDDVVASTSILVETLGVLKFN